MLRFMSVGTTTRKLLASSNIMRNKTRVSSAKDNSNSSKYTASLNTLLCLKTPVRVLAGRCICRQASQSNL